MPGPKTNELPGRAGARDAQPGTRAVLRDARVSAYKAREVLDLVRGRPVREAEDILRFSERDVAFTVGKVLQSAIANAENNDDLDPDELYVSACFADEGTTIKRWRPRARGRATRIRKRTSHITVIVSRLPEAELARLQAHRRAEQLSQRARRVAGARRAEGDTRNRADRRRGAAVEEHDHDHDHADGESAGTQEVVIDSAPETAEGDQPETAEGDQKDADPSADLSAGGEPVAATEAEAIEAGTTEETTADKTEATAAAEQGDED